MIDRVDKQLVFKWLNSGPYLHGETEPGINGRILGIGAYFKQPNDALANRLLGEQVNHLTHGRTCRDLHYAFITVVWQGGVQLSGFFKTNKM